MRLSEKNIIFANVIRLARHIEILLLGNDCVIVPDLGGFVAHHISARYDEEEGIFLPPLRTLGFNPQLLMNDSLLAQSYAEAYDLSYPEALDAIEEEVNELKYTLDNEGSYELNDLGRLFTNTEGRLSFEPFESGILTPSFYALSSFDMPVRHQMLTASLTMNTGDTEDDTQEETGHKARVVYIGRDDMSGQKTLNISLKAIRNISVAAVLLSAVFLITAPMFNGHRGSERESMESGFYEMLVPKEDVSKNISRTLNARPVKSANTAAKPAGTAETAQPQDETWSIVLCSHVKLDNAEAFVEKLKAQGLGEAYIRNGASVKVLYGKYKSRDEAIKALNTLNDNELFKSAWVLNVSK